MHDMEQARTKESLIRSLDKSHRDVADYFIATSPQTFFARPREGWSPSDNLDHQVRALRPLVKALKLPKESLRQMFGARTQPSRPFSDIRDAYLRALHEGAQASGRYVPSQEDPAAEERESAKARLLEQWAGVGTALKESLGDWSESQLDEYVVPHPILGNLTVREMLFFISFHNMRHISPEGD
jgi:hypothetical protein